MERDEFEYRLKELVTKVDSVVAADAMMEMARRCYLQHATEMAETRCGSFVIQRAKDPE